MKKQSSKIGKKIFLIIVLIFGAFLLSIGIQFLVNNSIEAMPQRPAESLDSGGSDRLIYYYDQSINHGSLPEGIELTETFVNSQLEGTFAYINGRYDVSDFRMNSLVRLLLGYGEYLPASTREEIKEVMLGFKYWMDQGGADSMCYWSENHQILFSTEEYLVGQTFPDDTFTVDGKSGAEHQEMAKVRINAWMEQRFQYGFTEWYSNNYYPEDIAPMANFIQFANDALMVNRMKMVLDLLFYDLASQSYRYEGKDPSDAERIYYVNLSSSGRMYSDNRVSDDTGNRLRPYVDYIMQPEETRGFANSWATSTNGFFNCFKQMMEAKDNENNPYYEVPAVIKMIFDDPAEAKIIRSSQSLDTEELETEGLLGQADPQIMMQFDMEAFTNPATIANTMEYIAKNKMFSNDFLNDFKLINLWPLRAFGLLGTVSHTLKPSTNGVAIERSNVYTYKTDSYSMHNAQAYQPGEYADQQAISQINLTNYLSIFTTQPAKIPRRSGTPTYWTGNGRQPYSVQEKNVQLTIYLPPEKPGFMEPMVVKETTHVFFPVELFTEVDESHLEEGMIFGKAGNAYIAVLTRYPLAFVPFDVSNTEGDRDDMLVRGSVKNVLSEKYDLIQEGSGTHYFVCECSDSSQETFSEFITRIRANSCNFDPDAGKISYSTILNGDVTLSQLEATYDTSFEKNGTLVDLDYERFESPYVKGGTILRKANSIVFVFGGESLTLNYLENQRLIGD
ncbi:MAG: hypothetical protein PHP61_04840 [Candidatus Izemoplasmatales bacterium]|nr:hypothetical protein [Candidatus Izemoplasmatales bacterium]MDD4355211.1 hypothetical protein [Candidatus Izemoplasmatales bacterium]MDD4988428.1 hypothetical protein [Candidatus Izemoplasmatales bacterium]MDD5602152.1 hypothetical protein [Candidatus Izemoplasmatales bacterium]MDY0373181.1 hypothetical protein [Candidatus Izemoplasmatales bacterium]